MKVSRLVEPWMLRGSVVANVLAINWKFADDVTVRPNDNGEVTIRYTPRLGENEEAGVMGMEMSVSNNVVKVVVQIIKDGEIVDERVREATSSFCLLKGQCRVS